MTCSGDVESLGYIGYKRHTEDDFKEKGFARYLIANEEVVNLIDRGKIISMHGKLRRDPKDAGALKIDKESIYENAAFYAEILTKTGLFRAVLNDVGSVIFPRKISHLVSDGLTKTLIWHRDSYRHNSRQVGPFPSPLKLAVYLTDVDKNSGVTGLNTALRNYDFNNRYLDTIAAYVMHPFAKFHTLSAGSAMLFDGRLMHYRGAQSRGHPRQVIIFSISQDPTQLPSIDMIETESFGLLHALMNYDPLYKQLIYQTYHR